MLKFHISLHVAPSREGKEKNAEIAPSLLPLSLSLSLSLFSSGSRRQTRSRLLKKTRKKEQWKYFLIGGDSTSMLMYLESKDFSSFSVSLSLSLSSFLSLFSLFFSLFFSFFFFCVNRGTFHNGTSWKIYSLRTLAGWFNRSYETADQLVIFRWKLNAFHWMTGKNQPSFVHIRWLLYTYEVTCDSKECCNSSNEKLELNVRYKCGGKDCIIILRW